MISLKLRLLAFSTFALAMLLGSGFFTAPQSADAVLLRPNLIVADAGIAWLDSHDQCGGEKKIFAFIKNTGNAPAAASAVRFDIDLPTLSLVIAVPAIQPGETVMVQGSTFLCQASGIVTGDAANQISESNERDNHFSLNAFL